MESRKVKPMSESRDLRCKTTNNKEKIQNRLSVLCSDLMVINRPKRSTVMNGIEASVANKAPVNPSASDDTQRIGVPKGAKIMRVVRKAPCRTNQDPMNTSESDDSRMAAPRRSRIMRVGGRAPSRASQVSVGHNGQMEVAKGTRVMRLMRVGGKAPSRASLASTSTSRNDSRIEVPEVSRIMRVGGIAPSRASIISMNSSPSDNSRTKVPKGSKIMRAGGKVSSRAGQVPKSTSSGVDSPREVRTQSEDDIKCAICYDTENSQDFQPVLCGHSFHKACFETWVKNQSYCPMCRTPIDFASAECMYKFRHFINHMGRWAVRAFAR